MISIIGLDLDACMIRFLVSISMHAAGSAATRAAATVVFSPSWDLAAMHTGGGSRPERGGSGSEFSLGMQTRQRSCRDNHLVHAVRLGGEEARRCSPLESHVSAYSLRSDTVISIYMLAVLSNNKLESRM